jgi:hypothetical protein
MIETENLLNKTIKLPTHVEKLALRPSHFLFLTAMPHYGDDDRFCHFLRLIDPDVFPEPHKFQSETKEIKRLIFPDENNMIRIPDPANKLEYAAKEIRAISHYEINGKEIDKFGGVGSEK